MPSHPSRNPFLDAPLGEVYVRTASPIILVMAVNGLLAVSDALFLGWYVGPEALAAVTLMFPIYMLIVALSTLVSSGMSSILARHLGAGRIGEARGVFAGAHGLALVVGFALIALFAPLGSDLTLLAAGGAEDLAKMGLIYLRITVFCAPLLFVLSVNSDALRNEGRVGFMAAMSLLASVANIVFNYLLIAELEWGVAGSAYGTALAQALAFAVILTFRMRGATPLTPSALMSGDVFRGWSRILALGAPQSLSFVGLALGSAAIMMMLQVVEVRDYQSVVSAYGVTTRVMTFAYLPLLGLSFAMQTITGNNYGASNWRRSDMSLRIAVAVGFAYCVAVQALAMGFAPEIGAAFVDEAPVIEEVAGILPIMVSVFFLVGPLMMIAAYFQAIGDAGSAALLSLSRTYLFAIPLTFAAPAAIGEVGVWVAGPAAEVLVLVLTVGVLAYFARRRSLRWGLFHAPEGAPESAPEYASESASESRAS